MEMAHSMASTGQITAAAIQLPQLRTGRWSRAFRPLHALIAAPAVLFLATLAVMLFRPPDMQFYWLDRIAFLLLLFVVSLRALVLRRPVTSPIRPCGRWRRCCCWGLGSLLAQPYDAQSWSVFAAKWVVPFALYHLAGSVFDDAASLRRFETFALVVLGYLCLIAILFLFGAKDFIFPRYILDESLGIHADRARGPFLQAVANGVTLNILGLIALDSFRRGRLKGLPALLLLIALPLAILATQTRAVWLSFAGCIPALLFVSSSKRVRRACLCLVLAGGVGLVTALSFEDTNNSFFDSSGRTQSGGVSGRDVPDRPGDVSGEAARGLGSGRPAARAGQASPRLSPVSVLLSQHLSGNCGAARPARTDVVSVDGYRPVSAGQKAATLTLAWREGTFLDDQFRSVWPVLVAVYLFNGSFVVMNYQFVNGLLFTIAGMLAAQNRQAEAHLHALPV